jgi:hypothetical protein
MIFIAVIKPLNILRAEVIKEGFVEPVFIIDHTKLAVLTAHCYNEKQISIPCG